jgi:hypothetical protein
MHNKGIEKLYNKILAEKFLKLEKGITSVQELYRTPNRNDQKRMSPHPIKI